MANIDEKILFLDKNAARGGIGTKESPFSCLSCAFSTAKKLLKEADELLKEYKETHEGWL